MKKIKIFNKTIACLALLLTVIYACEYKDFEYKADLRLSGIDGISIIHNNPKTGLPYTAEEIDALTYNPLEEETYLTEQPVVLDIRTEARPKVIKVISDADGTIIEEITTFTEESGNFVATLSSNVTALGVELGGDLTLLFVIEYDDLNVDGFDYPSTQEIRFKVKHFDPASIPDYYVYLKKQDGTVIGINTVDGASSKDPDLYYGKILTYDGVDDYSTLDAGSLLDFRYTEDFSIGFWVNTTSTDSDPAMIADQDWNSSGNRGMTIAFRGDNWRVAVSDGAGNKADARTQDLGIPFNDGEWHFLLTTFDRDGAMTMYQDGVEVASAGNMGSVTDFTNSNPLRIAQDGPGTYGQFFEGKIGNTYIYDYVLTPEQAAFEATKRSGVQLKKQNGSTKYVEVINSGASISEEEGRFTYSFNGTSQYASMADDPDLDFRNTGDYSISFWVNTTSSDSDPAMIADQNWNSSGNTGMTIAFRGSNWRTAVSDGAGHKADARTQDLGIPFNDGDWHFMAVTFDRDGAMVMYQDGVEVVKDDTNLPTVGNIDSGNPLRLAQDGPGTYGQFFEGSISNVVIYDYVISASDVSDLFNQ